MTKELILEQYLSDEKYTRYNSEKLSKLFNVSLEEIKNIRVKAKHIRLKKTEDGIKSQPVKESEKITLEVEHTIVKDENGLKIDISGNEDINDAAELLKLVKLNPDNFEIITFWRGFRKGKWWASIYAKPKSIILDIKELTSIFKESCLRISKDLVKKETEDGIYKKNKNLNLIVNTSKKLAVVCLFDIHLGKDSMYDYTGEESITSVQVFKEFLKIESLLKIQNIDEIHLIIGNDYFNVNDQRLTTVRGTPQDNTNNLYRTFKEGLNLLVEIINRLAIHSKINVILVPGNHANYTETLLAISLNSIYNNRKDIQVDDTPLDRKYIRFGKTLIGYSHGVKNPDLYAKLLPFEAKEHFSMCDNFYVLLGDKHHEHTTKFHPVQEIDGVTVMQLGALSKTDRWHTSEGYFSRRQSYLMIFDENKGLEAQYSILAD